jgi:hypothetical protein
MTDDARAAPADKKSWSDNKMALFGLPAESQRLTKMDTVAEAKHGGNCARQPSPWLTRRCGPVWPRVTGTPQADGQTPSLRHKPPSLDRKPPRRPEMPPSP